MNIDPNWITSILLFVIGAFLIATCVLALLLIEGKRAKARIEATLETSVARHKVLLGAPTEFGNNRTLGVWHFAPRSHECPEPPVMD